MESSTPMKAKQASTTPAAMAEGRRITWRQPLAMVGSRRSRHTWKSTPANARKTKASVQRSTNLGMTSLETDTGIGQGVGHIGQDQPDDVEGRPQKDHGSHDGKVLRVDGIDGLAAQTGNAEEGFCDEASHEQQGNGGHRPRQNG